MKLIRSSSSIPYWLISPTASVPEEVSSSAIVFWICSRSRGDSNSLPILSKRDRRPGFLFCNIAFKRFSWFSLCDFVITTKHGLNQAISRDGHGVSVAAINDAPTPSSNQPVSLQPHLGCASARIYKPPYEKEVCILCTSDPFKNLENTSVPSAGSPSSSKTFDMNLNFHETFDPFAAS